MAPKSNHWLKLVLIGIALIGVALLAGQLGLGSVPAFRIAQLLLAATGFCCACLGFLASGNLTRRLARSQTALIVGSMLAGLLLCEITSLLIEIYEQRGNTLRGEQTRAELKYLVHPIADPKLELRLPPNAGGHDAKGFRNEHVPARVDIVAIGDSQTWGINANRSEAWPQALARASGHSVYNMALGSYGTVHYWVLTDEALELSPRVIVVGLFLGNDIWDSYRMVYSLGMYPQFRAAQPNVELLTDTIARRYQETVEESEEFSAQFQKPVSSTKWYDFLRVHSAFARVFYRRGLWPAAGRREYEDYERNQAWATAYPDKGVVYDKGPVRTVFATSQHLLGLDLDEPRIAAGLRVTKQMLLLMQSKTARANVKLLLLLIPTKETVYAATLKGSGISNPTFDRVVNMASRVREEIVSLCNQNGIQYVDPIPALEQAIVRNEQIYPWTGDSHFLPRGYAILATEVKKSLAQTAW